MLQISSATPNLNILWENLLFLATATSFLAFAGWMWRKAKPFSLPQRLPTWFSAWLSIVLVLGIALPLVGMVLWGLWWGYTSVLRSLIPYFVMLALQILSESIILKQYQSCVWVMVPCVYLPYRIWQLYTGLILVSLEGELIWVQRLLILEIVLWIFNYGVHLSQLPRLLRWEIEEN
jgi:hypothetical protein